MVVAKSLAVLSLAVPSMAGRELPGCHRALQDISSRGHSDMELAATCHATLAPQFCREASTALGSQPWPEERISAACSRWEGMFKAARAPERQAMDWESLQQTLQQCMEAKATAGLCQNEQTGKPMTLNECVDHKQKLYPKKSDQIQKALNMFYNAAMGAMDNVEGKPVADAPLPEGKFQQTGPLVVGNALGFGLPLGLGCTAALAAGLVVAKRLRKAAGGERNVAFADSPALSGEE